MTLYGYGGFGSLLPILLPIPAKSDGYNADSKISKQIIDDSIMTLADAKEVANTQYDLLKTKRPSIKLTLDGIQDDLDLGKTINITLAKPSFLHINRIIHRI